MSSEEKMSFIKPEINERIGTLKPFSLAKSRDYETYITAKKRDCEIREIRLKFCETQSF